jgi:hypothetical protein
MFKRIRNIARGVVCVIPLDSTNTFLLSTLFSLAG